MVLKIDGEEGIQLALPVASIADVHRVLADLAVLLLHKARVIHSSGAFSVQHPQDRCFFVRVREQDSDEVPEVLLVRSDASRACGLPLRVAAVEEVGQLDQIHLPAPVLVRFLAQHPPHARRQLLAGRWGDLAPAPGAHGVLIQMDLARAALLDVPEAQNRLQAVPLQQHVHGLLCLFHDPRSRVVVARRVVLAPVPAPRERKDLPQDRHEVRSLDAARHRVHEGREPKTEQKRRLLLDVQRQKHHHLLGLLRLRVRSVDENLPQLRALFFLFAVVLHRVLVVEALLHDRRGRCCSSSAAPARGGERNRIALPAWRSRRRRPVASVYARRRNASRVHSCASSVPDRILQRDDALAILAEAREPFRMGGAVQGGASDLYAGLDKGNLLVVLQLLRTRIGLDVLSVGLRLHGRSFLSEAVGTLHVLLRAVLLRVVSTDYMFRDVCEVEVKVEQRRWK
mmetsp:Transcript_23221/g.58679  ORF Transcript_23221/g.58679 Transcript_23221/m.58679 type:complete len:455 (-) Transcript_23221:116-1480(-)